MQAKFSTRVIACVAALAAVQNIANADTRVQDVANLKGQRTNKLMGFGLVIGLNGTGDGGEVNTTRRALMALHQRFEQPVLDINEIDGRNIALVAVEASIPEFGAHEGQEVNVVVSALNGSTKSLKGGQLLMTPLQDASSPENSPIIAMAGGRIDLPDADVPTRGIIRRGATFEMDFVYNFIEKGHITLVLHETLAGYPWAQLVARAINQELASPRNALDAGAAGRSSQNVEPEAAVAIDPQHVRVKIPPAELPRPAWVISQILQTPLFVTPYPEARIVINRTSGKITVSGNVTILPTVLLIPGLGTVTVGSGQQAQNSGVVGLDTQKTGGVEFQELLETLSRMKLSGPQLIETIEQLHASGALPAELKYTE